VVNVDGGVFEEEGPFTFIFQGSNLTLSGIELPKAAPFRKYTYNLLEYS